MYYINLIVKVNDLGIKFLPSEKAIRSNSLFKFIRE